MGTHLPSAMLCLMLLGCGRSSQPETAAPLPEPVVDLQATTATAETGDAEAQRILGDLYAAGRSVPQNYKEAVTWYRKAADQGNAAAQCSLGELSEAGQGLPFSYQTAAEWYRKAADQGNASAAYNLAVLYTFGRGVGMNDAEAVRWQRKAAEGGNAQAQFNLGQRYKLGKGVPVDLVEAFTWLTQAAKTVPDAAKLRDEVRSEMKHEQIVEAQQRVDKLAPTVGRHQ